jgi:hypothetical protein
MAVGGPALVYYVTPSEEEIFKRYNPELQRRSLEGRVQRQEEFDHFVKHLKEYSKSDKHSDSSHLCTLTMMYSRYNSLGSISQGRRATPRIGEAAKEG